MNNESKTRDCTYCNNQTIQEKIKKGSLVKLLTINGKSPALREGDSVQVESVEKIGNNFQIMLAGYPLIISIDCNVTHICFSCGEEIESNEFEVDL